MSKAYNNLDEVDRSTKAGLVLVTAISMLSCTSAFAGKTPDEVLAVVVRNTFPPEGELPEAFVEAAEPVQIEDPGTGMSLAEAINDGEPLTVPHESGAPGEYMETPQPDTETPKSDTGPQEQDTETYMTAEYQGTVPTDDAEPSGDPV
jgi:hypothetical protein